MGRWLNRDRYEEKGGENLYGLVGNNSIDEWDYLGLSRKDIARGMWLLVVEHYLRPNGYQVAEYLFEYSLQDNPLNLFFSRNHFISQKIKNAQEFQQLVDKIVNDAPTGYHELSTQSGPVSIQLSSNRDLFLGINKAMVEYEGVICKVTNSAYSLDLTATIKDDYDFHFLISEYRKGFSSTVANNMAWMDQLSGVINNYSWKAEVHERRLRLQGGRF